MEIQQQLIREQEQREQQRREEETRRVEEERRQREQELREQELKFIRMHECAARIQGAYRQYISRCQVLEGLMWRQRIKMIIMNTVEAWRTRRALNCLGQEVQEFVNCEQDKQKAKLRRSFHKMFERVLSEKLYLEANLDQLQDLVNQKYAKAS